MRIQLYTIFGPCDTGSPRFASKISPHHFTVKVLMEQFLRNETTIKSSDQMSCLSAFLGKIWHEIDNPGQFSSQSHDPSHLK